jgi:dTDP-4-dehydrorhamnose reductase
MKTVLILGHNGMLGHVVERVLSKNQDILISILPDFRYPRDSVDFPTKYDYIINTVGTVKPCIKESDDDSILNAIYTNSILPLELAKYNPNSKIIHATTDCVYSGNKRFYNIDDAHDPTDVYGKSKSLGESKAKNVYNLRVSIIGFEQKTKRSLVEWFYNLPKGYKANGWTRANWNGITCLAWAKIVNAIITRDIVLNNVNHITPYGVCNKFQMLKYFKDTFKRDDIEVNAIPGENIDRTLASSDDMLNERLWRYAGYIEVPSVSTLIEEMYEWYKIEYPERFK